MLHIPQIMLRITQNDVDKMGIVFDFRKQYTIARVPDDYRKAEDLALGLVYALFPYVAEKLGIDYGQVVLVVISRNGKVVVCSNSRYRNWLYQYFQHPSLGYAQFYDDVAPELILEKLDMLCP